MVTHLEKREQLSSENELFNDNEDITERMSNLVKATTKPSPGEFFYIDGKKVAVWSDAKA
jgi:hypothetical protein